MISKKTKYALKALIFLAKDQSRGDPVLISEIAQKERIPRKFLELILLELKNAGLVNSRLGQRGGYFLRKNPDKISLGAVIRLLEGPISPLPCVSHSAYQKCEECIDETTCGLRMVMKEVRDATSEILDSTSLQDVVERTQHANATAMYFI